MSTASDFNNAKLKLTLPTCLEIDKYAEDTHREIRLLKKRFTNREI